MVKQFFVCFLFVNDIGTHIQQINKICLKIICVSRPKVAHNETNETIFLKTSLHHVHVHFT